MRQEDYRFMSNLFFSHHLVDLYHSNTKILAALLQRLCVQESISWMTPEQVLVCAQWFGQACSSAYRLLPATLLDTLRAVLCLVQAVLLSVLWFIRRCIYSVQRTRTAHKNRTNFVCGASVMCWAEGGREEVRVDPQATAGKKKPILSKILTCENKLGLIFKLHPTTETMNKLLCFY